MSVPEEYFTRGGWVLDFADDVKSLRWLCEAQLQRHGTCACDQCKDSRDLLRVLKALRCVKWEGGK